MILAHMPIHKESGYTFIELLIVMAILAIMVSVSIVALVRFRERSEAQTDALGLASHLRRIQVQAAAVEVPAGCVGVKNFAVTMSGKTASVAVNCTSGSVADLPALKYQMVKSTFKVNYQVTFDSRMISASPLDIDICGNKYSYRITISALANISQPSYLGSC